MRAAEFIFEALLHDTVKDIAIWISPHVDQQRQKPERNVSWAEINKILKRIKIVRPKLYDMVQFNQFYLRDNDTNVELGCVMVDLHGTQDETPTVKYLLKINTVIRSATPQARTSPVVTVNAVVKEDVEQLTKDDIIRMFNNKTVTSDVNDVLGWFPRQNVTFTVEHNVPLEMFKKQAEEMISTYDEFPQDADRAKRIRKLLTQGNPQLPIFVDASDNFILEGRHRITAFYELKIPTITVVWVHPVTEQLNEIDYADTLAELSIPPDTIIPQSRLVGKIDGLQIFSFAQGPTTLYFVKTNNNQYSALVLLNGNHIRAVKNYSKQPGLVTTIIGFIVHTLKTPLEITNTEPLTKDGLRWLRLLILRSGQGFTITDQDGNFPDVKKLEQEWKTSKILDKSGPTSITISESIKTLERLEEKSKLLISTTIWFGNERLL